MTFKKIESRKDELGLTFEDITNEIRVKKVCYVNRVDYAISKNDLGYYKLFIKTVDNVTITAFIFYDSNVNFIEKGNDIKALQSKFILLDCTPRLWNVSGRYSLMVHGIDLIDQNSVTNKGDYLGQISNLDDLFDGIQKPFSALEGKVFPFYFKTKAFKNIENGAIGGYVKFSWNVIYSLMVYVKDLNTDFLKVLYYTILYYEYYLERGEETGDFSTFDKVYIIKKISGEPTVDDIVIDTMSSILGLGKPEHLYANIIYNAFNNVLLTQRQMSDWKVMPVGGELKTECYVLKKY